MSYNFSRKVERGQMKSMLKEFLVESQMTKKQLDKVLLYHTKGEKIKGLRDRFDKMLKLAAGKYNPTETKRESSDIIDIEDAVIVEDK